MAKKKTLEDRFFPVATLPKLNQPIKPEVNQAVIKKIIQGSIQGAFQQKLPSSYQLNYTKLPKTLVSEEQTNLVIHLIESLQPADAIEAALASQFAISYIRGLEQSVDSISKAIDLFKFGHEVLEALTKFRAKGAQLISVNYNHNQGQINNIKIVKKEEPQTLEV